MIVGVTGFFASGKDTAAEFLVSRQGFAHVSLSDMIRRRLRDEGREISLPNLTETGNAMRRERGPGALAEMALDVIAPGADVVVTSIRHPAEVEALRRSGQFVLLFVDAPIETRYQRSLARNRAGDFDSFEAFKTAEEQQMRSPDSHAQRLAECRDMADEVIVNDGSIAVFEQRVAQVVEQARQRQSSHPKGSQTCPPHP